MRIGIDFGTSFSLPATVYLNERVVLLPGGKYGIPSLFFYSNDEGILIGEEAEDAAQGYAAKFLKREIKLDLNRSFIFDGKKFSAEEIVSHIIKYIEEVALIAAKTKLIDEEIDGVVISVPAAFGNNEKEIIRKAFCRANKDVNNSFPFLGFVKEPVAAAISYFETSLEDNTAVLVYDLGGGTCDVAVVKANSRSAEKYDVVNSGMIRVGGRDWDDAISEYIVQELKSKYDIDVYDDPAAAEKIKRASIKAKHSLSEKGMHGFRDKVSIHIDLNGASKTIQLTKERFDELTIDLTEKTVELVKSVIKETLEKDPSIKIEKMICVGGGSNMPQVINRLRSEFSDFTLDAYEPEKAICLGAAIYAEHCTDSDKFLQDIAPLSYGIRCKQKESLKEIISNLILRGEKLPVTSVFSFMTSAENQHVVPIIVYETFKDSKEYDYQKKMPDSKQIISVDLKIPQEVPKGYEFKVKMALNQSGLLQITAFDEQDNKVETEIKLIM